MVNGTLLNDVNLSIRGIMVTRGCEHLKNGVDWNAHVSSAMPGKQASRMFYSPEKWS